LILFELRYLIKSKVWIKIWNRKKRRRVVRKNEMCNQSTCLLSNFFINTINKPGEKFEFSLLMHEINVLTN
jgi:hypothetical protein